MIKQLIMLAFTVLSVALVRDFLQAPERYLRQIWIDEE